MDKLKTFWVDCGGKRGSNFGDRAAGIIVSQVSRREVEHCDVDRVAEADIVSIGSILHLIPSSYRGAIWGSGIIIEDQTFRFPNARICAVRGKLTAKRLGLKDVPLGDPLLLWRGERRSKFRLGIVPHYVDYEDDAIWAFSKDHENVLVVDMLSKDAADRIASCDFILSSALHGLVLADAMGIPNQWTLFSDDKIVGHGFKFRDYYSAFGEEYPIPLRFSQDHTPENLITWIEGAWTPKPIERVQQDLLNAFPKELIDYGTPSWDARNKTISEFIPEGASVLDLGAGTLSLKYHLPPGCKYVAFDIDPKYPEVVKWDFNQGVPNLSGFDFVVVSGVLEYLDTPTEFLSLAKNLGDKLIVTYSPWDNDSESRREAGWKNDLALEEIEDAFQELGLEHEEIGHWNEQKIWLLTKHENTDN